MRVIRGGLVGKCVMTPQHVCSVHYVCKLEGPNVYESRLWMQMQMRLGTVDVFLCGIEYMISNHELTLVLLVSVNLMLVIIDQ